MPLADDILRQSSRCLPHQRNEWTAMDLEAVRSKWQFVFLFVHANGRMESLSISTNSMLSIADYLPAFGWSCVSGLAFHFYGWKLLCWHTPGTSNKNVYYTFPGEPSAHSEIEKKKQSKRETDHIPHTLISLQCETRMHLIETITNENVRDNALRHSCTTQCVCSMLFMYVLCCNVASAARAAHICLNPEKWIVFLGIPAMCHAAHSHNELHSFANANGNKWVLWCKVQCIQKRLYVRAFAAHRKSCTEQQ